MLLRILCAILIIHTFSEIHAQYAWSKKLPTIGTFSSPRVADLNGDGLGDIIWGSGEEKHSFVLIPLLHWRENPMNY